MIEARGERPSGAVHTALDVLLGADLATLAAPELLAELAAVGAAANRLAAARAALLVEVEARRVEGAYAATRTTAELLSAVCPMTARAATQQVDVACALSTRRTLTGESLPALAPATADGCRAGAIASDQAAVIVSAVAAARSRADVAVAEIVERTLVAACPTEHAFRLRTMAEQLLAALEDDEPSVDEPDPRRGLSFRRRANGMWRGILDLTGPDHAAITAVLDPLSTPTPAPQSDGDSTSAGDSDPRSAAQRRADALVEVFARVQRSGTLPASGGAPVTVLVTTTLAELVSRTGVAVSDHGEPWPVADLLAAIRGEWKLVPVLTDDDGAVLRLGRAQRLASASIRRALVARDGGCCFPGCDRPPSYTEAHHIREWQSGGGTDLDNLCLLCTHHHRTFATAGWSVHVGEDLRPFWRPPPWLDPGRRPRRNTSQLRAELVFADHV